MNSHHLCDTEGVAEVVEGVVPGNCITSSTNSFQLGNVSPVIFLDAEQKAFQGCRMYLQLLHLEQKLYLRLRICFCLHDLPAPIHSTFPPKAPASEEAKLKTFKDEQSLKSSTSLGSHCQTSKSGVFNDCFVSSEREYLPKW